MEAGGEHWHLIMLNIFILERSGKARRQSSRYTGPDLVAETEENQYKEVLEVVAQTQWQVYKCSPLWNVKWKDRETGEAGEMAEGEVPSNIMRMSLERNVEREYDEQELKRVARMVTSYVATHSASGEDCPYRVEVVTMKGMKGIRTDSHALSLSVYTNMMEEEKRIFLGILCGVETAQLQLRSEDCVNLPLFLTQGNVDTRERVIYGLEKYFDCQISNLALPQLELRWMAAMWAGLEVRDASQDDNTEDTAVKKSAGSKGAREELRMTYGVALDQEPGHKQKIRHVTCVFPMGEIREVTCQHSFTQLIMLDQFRFGKTYILMRILSFRMKPWRISIRQSGPILKKKQAWISTSRN